MCSSLLFSKASSKESLSEKHKAQIKTTDFRPQKKCLPPDVSTSKGNKDAFFRPIENPGLECKILFIFIVYLFASGSATKLLRLKSLRRHHNGRLTGCDYSFHSKETL
jgi:hypothetical protein